MLQMHFLASNNVAEYEALLYGLQITMALDIRRLKILGDSLLVINQANKEWSCLDDKVMAYCQEIHKLENNFDGLEYHHVLRGRNEVVHKLAKLGSSRTIVPPGVFMQELHERSISKALSMIDKAVKSVDDAATPANDKSNSSNIMLVDSN
jgi:ribonuclease HI